MSLIHYAQFTCWTSIVLLLWGMITKLIEQSFTSWFAFGFFLGVVLMLGIISWNKQ